MSAYPDDQAQLIRDLQNQVKNLANEVKNLRGLVITKASGAFFLPNVSTPSAPSGGVQLYASGGEPFARTPSETISLIPPEVPFTQGVAVPDVPVFNSDPNPPMNVAGLHAAYQDLRDDCQSGLRQRLIQLKNSLEGGGFIA